MDPRSVAVCNTPRAGQGGTFQLVVDTRTSLLFWVCFRKKVIYFASDQSWSLLDVVVCFAGES